MRRKRDLPEAVRIVGRCAADARRLALRAFRGRRRDARERSPCRRVRPAPRIGRPLPSLEVILASTRSSTRPRASSSGMPWPARARTAACPWRECGKGASHPGRGRPSHSGRRPPAPGQRAGASPWPSLDPGSEARRRRRLARPVPGRRCARQGRPTRRARLTASARGRAARRVPSGSALSREAASFPCALPGVPMSSEGARGRLPSAHSRAYAAAPSSAIQKPESFPARSRARRDSSLISFSVLMTSVPAASGRRRAACARAPSGAAAEPERTLPCSELPLPGCFSALRKRSRLVQSSPSSLKMCRRRTCIKPARQKSSRHGSPHCHRSRVRSWEEPVDVACLCRGCLPVFFSWQAGGRVGVDIEMPASHNVEVNSRLTEQVEVSEQGGVR